MPPVPRVFISYSHDSHAHRAFVLACANRLRADGLDCQVDQYVNGFPPEGWQRWMENQIEQADFVLLVCTPVYLRRYRGLETDSGRGVNFEGVVISQTLYDHFQRNTKFIPVVSDAGNLDDVPLPLKAFSTYRLMAYYGDLYRVLTAQPATPAPEMGERVVMGSVFDSSYYPLGLEQQLALQIELLQKQNFSTQAINSFFQIMKLEHVPPQDYEQKLQEIAQSFRELKERLTGIQTSDKEIIAFKQQADQAIDNGQFEQAKQLLDQAEQQAMDSHVENRLMTAAEIAATKGALASTQLQYVVMGEAYEDAANKMAALGEQHHEKWSEYLNWAGQGFSDAGQYKHTEHLVTSHYRQAAALIISAIGGIRPASEILSVR